MLHLKLKYFGHLMQRANSLEKTLMLGKTEGNRRRWQRMRWVGWHHWLNGHEFEQTPGDSEGQGSLVCCSLWGCKESDMPERLNNNNNIVARALSPRDDVRWSWIITCYRGSIMDPALSWNKTRSFIHCIIHAFNRYLLHVWYKITICK